MAILAANRQFAKRRVLVEIVCVVDHEWTPHMAIHARTNEGASKTEGVLFVTRRKSPALRVCILASGVVRERCFKKVISSSYDIPGTRHRLSQSICNSFGFFREFCSIWAGFELA